MKPILLKLKNKFNRDIISAGLDIGTSSVKLIKLKFSKESVELCGFNFEPIRAESALADELKAILHSQAIKRVNISVSGTAVMIRYADFPKMKEDELRQSLKFEAQKYFPFSIGDVNLDGRILIPVLPDNKMLVLLAAVKKEFINQRLKLIQDAGIKSNIVDIDSIALINAFNFNYSKDSDSDSLKHKTIALLNIGASLSNLNILEDGIPHLSRDIQIAGNNFTQKIQEALGVDFRTAEELKLKPVKEKLGEISSAGESVLSNIAGEIRTSFDYYESQSASSVGKIFLSGGGSVFAGLKDALTNLLGIEVEYWDPLRQINISSNIDAKKAKELSGQLAVAIGLALRK